MIAATISGIALLSAIVFPGTIAIADPSVGDLGFAVASAGIALAAGGMAYGLARSGFEALFREVPF
jgi:hypothetical protein